MSRPQVTKRYGQGQAAVVRMSAEEAWVGSFGEVAPWPRYGRGWSENGLSVFVVEVRRQLRLGAGRGFRLGLVALQRSPPR